MASKGTKKKKATFPEVPFTVEVLIPNLNIRKGAGYESSTTGGFTGTGKFKIVEVNGEWGKLKSGAGWIYIGNEKWVKLESKKE